MRMIVYINVTYIQIFEEEIKLPSGSLSRLVRLHVYDDKANLFYEWSSVQNTCTWYIV
jgi:hypothetical protein